MQAIKNLKKTELIRWGILALSVIVFLVGVKGCHSLFSSLGKKKVSLSKQLEQAEILIAHTSKLDAEQLKRELEELNGRLESPVQVSNILEELNRFGEQNSLSFKSVEPTGGEQDKYLGIRMEIEGSFESFGKFLGSLDKMTTALARVKSFELKGQGQTTPPYLSLELELYRPHQEGA